MGLHGSCPLSRHCQQFTIASALPHQKLAALTLRFGLEASLICMATIMTPCEKTSVYAFDSPALRDTRRLLGLEGGPSSSCRTTSLLFHIPILPFLDSFSTIEAMLAGGNFSCQDFLHFLQLSCCSMLQGSRQQGCATPLEQTITRKFANVCPVKHIFPLMDCSTFV